MAKNARRRGPRRAYLKKYSGAMVNGTQGIDRMRLNDLNYHGRAQGLADETNQEKLLRIFGLGSSQPNLLNQPSRVDVLKKLSKMLTGVVAQNHIVLYNRNKRQLVMLYTREEFFFIERNDEEKTIRKSILYPSRERSMLAYQRNRIVWVENARITSSG